MFNSKQLGYKDNPPLKCSECGTRNDVRKVIHLPLTNGRAGHISLTKWTNYCPTCLSAESKKFDDLINAAYGKVKK